jgi:hypothetical protein
MLTFKSFASLSQLDSKLEPSDPCRAVIHDLLHSYITSAQEFGTTYVSDHDGYVVLIDHEDTERKLDLFTPPRKLEDVFWEGVHVSGDYFVAVFVPNNRFSLTCVIENSDSLPLGLRRVLCANLVPEIT